jgi:signal transduction protein with GAF and PtsI domain
MPRSSPTYDKSFHDRELISNLLEFTAEYQVDNILRLVVNRIPRLVRAREASLFWLDRERNQIRLRATYDANRGNIDKRTYQVGEGLTGWVAKTGRPLRIKSIENEAELRRIDPNLKWVDKYGGFASASPTDKARQRAFLAVPIKIDGATMGVLRISKMERPNQHFSQADQDLIVTFAGHLAHILKKAEVLQRAKDFENLLEPVFFRSPEALDGYLRSVANLIPTIFNSKGCTIFLKDESSGSYALRYASKGNPLAEKIGEVGYYKGEGLTGWVLSQGESLRVNDIENEEELRHISPDLKWAGKLKEFLVHHSNFLAAPIRTPTEVYGAIRLSKDLEGNPFSEEDERLLRRYARILGSAIESLRLTQAGTMVVRPKWKGWYPVIENCCFVLMPYRPLWANNVRRVIKTAVESRNLIFRIADEETGPAVMEDIWKGICEARVIVADLSTANPNVAYEVGLADVVGKKMILLAQDPKKVPFDFVGTRLLLYRPDRLDELQDRLMERIEQLLGVSSGAPGGRTTVP